MCTLYVLVRNLDADGELQFRDFRIREIRQGHRAALDEVRRLLRTEDVNYGDWLIEREYAAVPAPARQNPAGVGRIPLDAEDMLLLLQLFKPGDLSFARLGILMPDGDCRIQSPYRVIGNLVDNSVFPYGMRQTECAEWDRFADELMQAPAWSAPWFVTARRFFLYGGAKEFNPRWEEIDRIADYTIVLEAALVPEKDFVGARLRNRAARLLQEAGPDRDRLVRLLRDIYGDRSSIVHGSALPRQRLDELTEVWAPFEQVVREVLVAALRRLPLDDDQRATDLKQIYEVTDQQRADKVREDFRAIGDEAVRRRLVEDLDV
jgi:hypothetical protein